MIEEEYLQKLREIIHRIKVGELDFIQEELMALYKYKPVRLLWHVAYGEWLVSQNKHFEAWDQVSKNCWVGLRYRGVKEFSELHRALLAYWQDTEDLKMLDYRYGDKKIRMEKEQQVEQVFSVYVQDSSQENLQMLMMEYYKTENWLMFLMIRNKLCRDGYIKNDNKEAWYYKLFNYDYLEQRVCHIKKSVVLVQEESNQKECDLLSGILHEFENQVYILAQPVLMEIDVLHTEELAKICIENQQVYEDAIVIPVIEAITTEGKKENNRAEILNYLHQYVLEEGFALLFASGTVMYSLMEQPVLQKHVECLTEINHINRMDKMYFGWVGDYQRYISDIYGFDVKERLQEPVECDFSIVVPARNSAGTLYYTLQTCLNQDYKGSYEIIVSDNSTNGNQEVYQVCQDLKDSRIKYVKTPRNLQLTKSFEYAFLQAKGEFIFSIGSDDGVCPWALSVLNDILKNNSEDEIVQWQRGYYGWKGFNSGQENELVIPECYADKELKCNYVENIEYFARIFKNSQWMYGLPTLYINSGFRRSYFNKLLQKTGRLWDGCNQDIYMGVMTATINAKILNVEFPLTVAGMSNNSLGYVVGKPKNLSTSQRELEISKSTFCGDNCGIYVQQGIVRDMPLGTGEVFSLYANILRAIQLGVLPEIWRTEVLDDKKIFSDFFKEHTCLDDFFDKYLHYARYLAEKRGDEFLTWFDETIYKPSIVPRYCVKKDVAEKEKKSYREGFNSNGSLIVDASKYGVTNIVEAVKLFEELIYWTPETYEQELEKRKVHD